MDRDTFVDLMNHQLKLVRTEYGLTQEAMARALGEHDRDKTRHCCAVAIWSTLGGAVVYAVLLALFQRPLLGRHRRCPQQPGLRRLLHHHHHDRRCHPHHPPLRPGAPHPCRRDRSWWVLP